jgi:hypothetical protein
MRATTRIIVLLIAAALGGCGTSSSSQLLDARATCQKLAQASASSPDLVSKDYTRPMHGCPRFRPTD